MPLSYLPGPFYLAVDCHSRFNTPDTVPHRGGACSAGLASSERRPTRKQGPFPVRVSCRSHSLQRSKARLWVLLNRQRLGSTGAGTAGPPRREMSSLWVKDVQTGSFARPIDEPMVMFLKFSSERVCLSRSGNGAPGRFHRLCPALCL